MFTPEATRLRWLWQRICSFDRRVAVIWDGHSLSYGELAGRIELWSSRLNDRVGVGEPCAVVGDDTADACAAMLALLFRGAVAVPLCSLPLRLHDRCLTTARVSQVVNFTGEAGWQYCRRDPGSAPHPLLEELNRRGAAGIVLFTSGSSGDPKAVVWDAEKLIAKHKDRHKTYTTLSMLRLDHIGGLNTLFHTLCGGGTLVVTRSLKPAAVLDAVQRYRVQLLPTTPTFLRMMLISRTFEQFDLSSLELITYGTEPMSPGTLEDLCAALPHVRFKQTYGLSEIGILPTQSTRSDSVWLRLGGDDLGIRVVNGTLWVRAPDSMLGYLNAASPLDADGWLNTQDAVEVEGDAIRILGRRSEIINVGGEKVYPAEVEEVITRAGNVQEAIVYGQRNPITGQVVAAKVRLIQAEAQPQRRIMEICRARLAPHQVPMIIDFADGPLHNERGKTVRRKGNQSQHAPADENEFSEDSP
ncbi:MAG TPA: AMP-binding protein [Pirellulaceae bacterium]|nr:AMP-binding protein [Pirellulaceae bacterium]